MPYNFQRAASASSLGSGDLAQPGNGVVASKSVFLLRPDKLPPELRAAVTYRELAAGEALYRRGDTASALFAVQRGRLQLLTCTSEGKVVPLYSVWPGDCVSEAALFADCYCGDVIADIPSRVAVFPKPLLAAALRDNPCLSEEFIRLLTRRFNLLRIRLELRSLPSARDRILQYLAISASPGKTTVAVDRPLKGMADDLGLTHESFYRTLSQLAKEGLISRKKGEISFRPIPSHDRNHTEYEQAGVTVKVGELGRD